MRFGKKGKLAARYVGPFLITERVGISAFQLALRESLSHVHDVFHVSMLRKCIGDFTPIVNFSDIVLWGMPLMTPFRALFWDNVRRSSTTRILVWLKPNGATTILT